MKIYTSMRLGDQNDLAGVKQLAFSILADVLGTIKVTSWLAKSFADVVNKFDQKWEITSEDVLEWCRFKCQLGYSMQEASLGHKSSNLSSEPLFWPRLVKNPNYRLTERQPRVSG